MDNMYWDKLDKTGQDWTRPGQDWDKPGTQEWDKNGTRLDNTGQDWTRLDKTGQKSARLTKLDLSHIHTNDKYATPSGHRLNSF